MNILTEVRDYVRQRQRVSLIDIAYHFDSKPEAMRGMLDVWVVRGSVKHCPATACGGCSSSCSSLPSESYEWREVTSS